jgi:hypothetical protein
MAFADAICASAEDLALLDTLLTGAPLTMLRNDVGTGISSLSQVSASR